MGTRCSVGRPFDWGPVMSQCVAQAVGAHSLRQGVEHVHDMGVITWATPPPPKPAPTIPPPPSPQ